MQATKRDIIYFSIFLKISFSVFRQREEKKKWMQRRTKSRTKFYQDTFYQDTVYDSTLSRTLNVESGKCRYHLHCYLFISTECSYYFDWYVAGFYMINPPQSELKSRTVAIHGGISHNEAPSRALVGRTINETSATKTSTFKRLINQLGFAVRHRFFHLRFYQESRNFYLLHLCAIMRYQNISSFIGQ